MRIWPNGLGFACINPVSPLNLPNSSSVATSQNTPTANSPCATLLQEIAECIFAEYRVNHKASALIDAFLLAWFDDSPGNAK